MVSSNRDEFFIGYQPQAPSGIAARSRSFVLLALLVALGASAAALFGFKTLPKATFEFGNLRRFEGTLQLSPYPALHVSRPGVKQGVPESSRYHLVGPFKFGANSMVAEYDGQRVSLEGTLVHRDGQSMIEVLPDSIASAAGEALAQEGSVSLGEHALVGEIVDSKCFLGVMNPGNLKPHRACAVRCISGGIPPVLCVRDEEGRAEYLLLVGESGEALNDQVLDFVALPMEITGRVERLGDQLILRTSPDQFRVL